MAKESVGKITVGYGTVEQKELNMVDFIQAEFKDHRLINISLIEDGSYVACVENPKSTGRATQQSIWLSKESFIGLLSTIYLYFTIKNENIEELLKEAVEKRQIGYRVSDNLKPLTPTTKEDKQ